ncbi:unnamed protein product [Withania somnifera]
MPTSLRRIDPQNHYRHPRRSKLKISRNLEFGIACYGDKVASVGFDVPFPKDYTELLQQANETTELALKDSRQLMEIEFPAAGLGSIPGDGEGGTEMTGSVQLICLLEDFGFNEKVKMADRVKPEDELFIVAYPYFNVNEMLVVEELYKEAVPNTSRKLIIFNGELDRIRSGYYPPFFHPKLAALPKTLFPKTETLHYIHNFKGRIGGVLFRCYPGNWKVFRRVGSTYI